MKYPILYTSALFLTGVAPLLTGCRNNTVAQPAPIVDGNAMASDPASANLLNASGNGAPQYRSAPVTRVAAAQYVTTPQAASESYPQQAAPNYGAGNSGQNEAYQYNTQQPQYAQQPQYDAQGAPITSQEYDQYSDLLDSNVPAATQPPPPLPADYEQPEAPGPDYLWTPGYWDNASAGYYYVPGTWVAAPYQGALWTPGWWGYVGNRYRWHHGYWGRHVGYYGGINYGFGFIGFGYQGGYWNGDHFFYNRAVNHVSPRVVNNYVYERRVSVSNNTYINNSRTSFVGGQGGLRRGPAPQEFAALHEQRTPPMQAQLENRRAAEQNRQQFFNANNGRPAMLAASRPLSADRGVVAPPRSMPGQGFGNARPEGFPANGAGSMNPQQRQQFEQGQRLQVEQQRQQLGQQQNLQRQQQDAQRLQLNQQREQGQQANIQQRQAEQQQRQQLDVQRQQQVQGNIQQRQAEQQQRQQLDVQRQQQIQGNIQQRQVEQQQRQQLDVQRQQQVQENIQQRQTQDQQRTQQVQQRAVEQQQRQQLDVQRQQQVNAQQQQRQQFDVQRQQAVQQRQQMDVQRQQQNVQREQSMRPAPAAAPRVEAPRAAPAPQHMEAPRAAPAPHVEAPHAVPAPHAEGPHH